MICDGSEELTFHTGVGSNDEEAINRAIEAIDEGQFKVGS
jgi:hypothetical protein